MGLHFLAASDVPVGQYLNGLKFIPVVIVLLIWAKALTWVDKDAEVARLPRDMINIGLMLGLIAGFAAFFFLPNFFIALLALLAVPCVEAGVYLSMRKKTVGLKDLRGDFKNWIRSFGRDAKPVEEIAGAVQIVGPNGLLPAPKADSPEAESYNGIQTMLTDPLTNNAEVIEIGPVEGGVVVKYSVDGVTYTGASVSKTLGSAAIAYLKAAAGLDMGEVRKPQKGTLKLNVNGKKKELQLETKGSTAGEFARFLADAKKRHDFAPDNIGFTDWQLEILQNNIKSAGGVTLLTMPKGQGLTSLSYAVLRGHDAFLQNIVTIERDQEQDLEGITQNKLERGATAAEEAKLANWIISQQPDVVLMSKPESPQGVADLIKYAKDHHVYFSFSASSAFEALYMFKKLVGDDRLAASNLNLSINGRNLRKLCAACKQGYTPDPETLRKLNMDASKVEKLFQARKEPIRDPKGNPIKCEFCNDLRYTGRTGMYEFVQVDDPIKMLLTNGMSAEQNAGPMKSAFRKQKGRYLQEVGLAMVEQGDTSVQEVLRVLRAGGDGGGATGSSPSVPRAPRKPKGPSEAA
jgi:type IV pilus assembly protein PilB